MARRRGTAGPGTGGRLRPPPPGDPPFLGAAQRGDSGSTATRCIASGGVSRFLSSAFARGRCWWGYFYYFVWVFFFFFFLQRAEIPPAFPDWKLVEVFPTEPIWCQQPPPLRVPIPGARAAARRGAEPARSLWSRYCPFFPESTKDAVLFSSLSSPARQTAVR